MVVVVVGVKVVMVVVVVVAVLLVFLLLVLPVFAKCTCTPKSAPRAYFRLKSNASDAAEHEESEYQAKVIKFPLTVKMLKNMILKAFKCGHLAVFKWSGVNLFFANTGMLVALMETETP